MGFRDSRRNKSLPDELHFGGIRLKIWGRALWVECRGVRGVRRWFVVRRSIFEVVEPHQNRSGIIRHQQKAISTSFGRVYHSPSRIIP